MNHAARLFFISDDIISTCLFLFNLFCGFSVTFFDFNGKANSPLVKGHFNIFVNIWFHFNAIRHYAFARSTRKIIFKKQFVISCDRLSYSKIALLKNRFYCNFNRAIIILKLDLVGLPYAKNKKSKTEFMKHCGSLPIGRAVSGDFLILI